MINNIDMSKQDWIDLAVTVICSAAILSAIAFGIVYAIKTDILNPKMCEYEVGKVRAVYYSQPTLFVGGYFILDVDGEMFTVSEGRKMYQVGDIYYVNNRCN